MTEAKAETGLKIGTKIFSRLYGPKSGDFFENIASILLTNRQSHFDPYISNTQGCPDVMEMIKSWASSGGTGDFFMNYWDATTPDELYKFTVDNKPKLNNLYFHPIPHRDAINIAMLVNANGLRLGAQKLASYKSARISGSSGFYNEFKKAYDMMIESFYLAKISDMYGMVRLYVDSDNFINNVKTYGSGLGNLPSGDIVDKFLSAGTIKDGDKVMHEIRKKLLSYETATRGIIEQWFSANLQSAINAFRQDKEIADSFFVASSRVTTGDNEGKAEMYATKIFEDIYKVQNVFEDIYAIFEIMDAIARGSKRIVTYSNEYHTALYKDFFEKLSTQYGSSGTTHTSKHAEIRSESSSAIRSVRGSQSDCLDVSSFNIDMVVMPERNDSLRDSSLNTNPEKKEEKKWWKFWGSNCIRIGTKEIDHISGPESLTYFHGKNSQILLFGDSYLPIKDVCSKCTVEEKCIFMDNFLETWQTYPGANGDFFFETKSALKIASTSDLKLESKEAKGVRKHHIDIRSLPNIKTIFDTDGLNYVHDSLHRMILKSSPHFHSQMNPSKSTQKLIDSKSTQKLIDSKSTQKLIDSKSTSELIDSELNAEAIQDLCGKTQSFFKANEYTAKQLTTLLGMYMYSDNFVEEMSQVIPDLPMEEMTMGTVPVIVNEKESKLIEGDNISELRSQTGPLMVLSGVISSSTSASGSVHKIRKQILKLDKYLQEKVFSWFNNTVKFYVDSYITRSSITPKLVHALTESSSKEELIAAAISFKKCIINMLRMNDILMDAYAIGKMMKTMTVHSSKNIIVYAGGYHVETYRDFFHRYLDMKYITAPKTAPRCLDLSQMDVELVPTPKMDAESN
jgi:uncharacterized short protein YbdD (DUF466 family)